MSGRWLRPRTLWFRHVTTDAKGRFELTDVPPDETLEVSIRAQYHAELLRQKVKTSVGRLDFELK